MDKNKFLRVHRKFDELEKRGSFYDMALNLISKGFEVEAYILILATWNFASFRYAMNTFDLQNFKDLTRQCKNEILILNGKNIKTANLDELANTIKKAYTKLSKSKGILFTGASKLLHLMNNDLFVMWDGHIRKHYGFGTSAEEYLKFLKKMQEKFKDISWDEKKTLAKVIDEYNYVEITIPALEKQRSTRKNKRVRK